MPQVMRGRRRAASRQVQRLGQREVKLRRQPERRCAVCACVEKRLKKTSHPRRASFARANCDCIVLGLRVRLFGGGFGLGQVEQLRGWPHTLAAEHP